MNKHIAVWMDHQQARIFEVRLDPQRRHHVATETTVVAPDHRAHRHQRGHDGEGHEHPRDTKVFFEQVRSHLHGAGQILILGPSGAKQEFMADLEARDRALAAAVIAVKTVDHPTDPEIVALAAQHFMAAR